MYKIEEQDVVIIETVTQKSNSDRDQQQRDGQVQTPAFTVCQYIEEEIRTERNDTWG